MAKLFRNGRSQAVRLPAEFRFHTKSVLIRKDPATGDVILSPQSDSWDEFFKLPPAPSNFLNPRSDPVPERGDPFETWTLSKPKRQASHRKK
jgi:antitoxin VapB